MKQTASQTVGPYFRIGLIDGKAQNVLLNEQTLGERIVITGRVLDGDAVPVPDAMLEIWQPDAQGIFNHPTDPLHEQADPHFNGFGRAENHEGGLYRFETVKPGGRDGAAPFINVTIFARGMLTHAMTRIYFDDEATNATDAVLNSVEAERRQTLIATLDNSETTPIYHFDIHLQGDRETVFFEPAF